MEKARNFVVQAAAAERAQAAALEQHAPLDFEEDTIFLLRSQERETAPDIVVIETARVMRVEVGHVLLNLGDRRVWLDKSEALRRHYDAVYVSTIKYGLNFQSIPKKV